MRALMLKDQRLGKQMWRLGTVINVVSVAQVIVVLNSRVTGELL
jgi:hypothetical protein